jgi:hypothetical protein
MGDRLESKDTGDVPPSWDVERSPGSRTSPPAAEVFSTICRMAFSYSVRCAASWFSKSSACDTVHKEAASEKTGSQSAAGRCTTVHERRHRHDLPAGSSLTSSQQRHPGVGPRAGVVPPRSQAPHCCQPAPGGPPGWPPATQQTGGVCRVRRTTPGGRRRPQGRQEEGPETASGGGGAGMGGGDTRRGGLDAGIG